MEITVEVWVIDLERKILVTDYPGPPASIIGYVSPEARSAAKERGCATVSELGFPSECYLGHFDGWEAAMAVAVPKAKELGYRLVQDDSYYAMDVESDPDYDWDYDPSDDEPGADDDEDDYGNEDRDLYYMD